MKVYIIRHGEVLHNRLKIYDSSDEELTDLGIAQAEVAKDKLKDVSFDVIYASPLKRTRQTAHLVNENHYPIIFDERLRERICGNLSGKPLSFTNREEYWNYYSLINYAGEETMKDFFTRVFSFIEDLKKENFQQVLVVLHSGVSKAFSAYFEGIQDGLFLNRGLKNCEIKVYNLE